MSASDMDEKTRLQQELRIFRQIAFASGGFQDDITLSLVEESFKNDNIQIAIHPDGDPLANGYPNQYSQALLNILTNARDALVDRKVPEPRIALHIFAEGDKAVVTITDNAGGIADEILGRLFDPYFTVVAKRTPAYVKARFP